MAFRQVKDLLTWTHDFHEQLGLQYARLADDQQDERMKMPLAFLADRERRMQEGMTAYLGDADEGLLTTWLIDSQEFGHPQILGRIPQCLGCHDVHDILANVMTAHQTLKDMYRLRAELAEIPEEAELFQHLAEQHDAEARLQARDLARLDFTDDATTNPLQERDILVVCRGRFRGTGSAAADARSAPTASGLLSPPVWR